MDDSERWDMQQRVLEAEAMVLRSQADLRATRGLFLECISKLAGLVTVADAALEGTGIREPIGDLDAPRFSALARTFATLGGESEPFPVGEMLERLAGATDADRALLERWVTAYEAFASASQHNAQRVSPADAALLLAHVDDRVGAALVVIAELAEP